MIDDNIKSQIDLFMSIFKGRDDVFAIRWEKGSKSGYMPAYLYDIYRYRMHKMKGGTFQNFTKKHTSLIPKNKLKSTSMASN